MWTLERGLEACRALQRIAEPFGFSVALYGAVLVNGTGNDLDVFLVPQREDTDVRTCVEAIRNELHRGVTGPLFGKWNRLVCNIRPRPDAPDTIDLQFTRLSAPPDGVAEGAVFYGL